MDKVRRFFKANPGVAYTSRKYDPVDERSYDLAEYFLADEVPPDVDDPRKLDLAACIQQAVEEWFYVHEEKPR